ncbi:hypothetical protein FKM82_026485 [Ascaphus truei]
MFSLSLSLRAELRDLGITLILNLRDSTNLPECLLQMLRDSQDSVYSCIHRTLFLSDTDTPAAGPCDLLNAQVSTALYTLSVMEAVMADTIDIFKGWASL